MYTLWIDFDYEKHENKLSDWNYDDVVKDYKSSGKSIRNHGGSVEGEFNNDDQD
jgi:hypothetical protein